MCEADIQTDLGYYLRTEKPTESMVIELKLVKLPKKKSFAFSQVEEHQEEALLKANTEGKYHKIGDYAAIIHEDGSKEGQKKPFDCVWLTNIPAYIAVCFWQSRKQKLVYLLDITTYLDHKQRFITILKRKSMKENEVAAIAYKIIDLLHVRNDKRQKGD